MENKEAEREKFNNLAIMARTDDTAFEKLYNIFYPRVFNMAYGYLKNAADADDVTAEVMMKVFRNLNGFDASRASFSTWLYRVAYTSIIDGCRRAERSLHKNESLDDQEEILPDREELQPEQSVLASEQQERLMALVRELSDKEKDVVLLRFQGNLSHKEIAEITGITAANSATILTRALAKLKKKIGNKEDL